MKVSLAADRLTSSQRPSRGRLVLVHGFSQTRHSWARIAATLNADGYDVITVDAPGHGGSSTLRLDLHAGASALGEAGGSATYVGYSMGGRLALHLAVARPELVERLVLVSSTAGIDDDAARTARLADDERRAEELERDGIAAFLDRWLALPLFANLSPDDAQLADRLDNTVEGLASSLRLAGTGTQQSLWPQLTALAMPVLLVAGRLDSKFATIAEQMAALIPHANVAVVPDAGHVVHLERPDTFIAILRGWLDATG